MVKITTYFSFAKKYIKLAQKHRKKGGRELYALISSISKIRSGSKLSRLARHTLERVNVARTIGKNIGLLIVISAVITPSFGFAHTQPEINTLAAEKNSTKTEIIMQYPVSPVVLNQGYHPFHRGIDLGGKGGDPIKPIMKGVVLKTERSRFVYGNSIIVEHENGHRSLYAHLSKINSKEGDEVDTKTVIGEVGSTGRSTGNHLHLEVYKDNVPINPKSILVNLPR